MMMDRSSWMPAKTATKMIWRAAVSLLAVGLLAGSCGAQVPRITDVEIEKLSDRVELTARADAPMSYGKVEFPGKMHALGIEIPAIMEASAFHKRGVHSGGILSVRSVQYRSKPPLARLMASCSGPLITTVYELDGGRILKLVVWKADAGYVPSPQGGPAGDSQEPQQASGAGPARVAEPESQSEVLLAQAPGSLGIPAGSTAGAAAEPPDEVMGWSETSPTEPAIGAQHANQPGFPGPQGSPDVSSVPQEDVFCRELSRLAVDAASWATKELINRCLETAGAESDTSPGQPAEKVAGFQGTAPQGNGGTSSVATPPSGIRRQEKLAARPVSPKSQTVRRDPESEKPPAPQTSASSAAVLRGEPEERVAAMKQEMVFSLDEGAADGAQPTIDLDFVDSDIVDVIKAISVQSGVNVVAGPEVTGKITLTLTDVTVEEAMNYVSRLSGYQFAKVGRAYVVGTPAGIRAMSDEAAVTPKTSVFTLSYVAAETVTAVLNEQIAGLTVSTGAAEGVETVIVSGSAADVDLAAEIIEALDSAPMSLSEGWGCEIYFVSHADPIDLIRILGSLVPNVDVILGPTSAFKGGKSASAQGTSSLIPTDGSGGSGPAVAMPGTEGGAPGPTAAGGGVSVQTSGPASNMLILTGPDEALERASEVLGKIDVPQKQALIQVKITDIALDDSEEFGFEWSWSNSTITEMVFTPTGEDLPNMTTMGADYTPWHFRRTPQAFTVMMDALFQSGEAKLLANPSVAVMNNREASFFIGDKILYPVIAGISQGTTIYNINTEEVGIGIDVTPQIGADGSITLYIHPYVSSITSYLQTPQGNYPQTSRRETQTTIMVKNGETIVIGGLLRDNEINILKKFPLLGDLPLLGEIFRHRTKQKTHSEVMIMITCEIIGE